MKNYNPFKSSKEQTHSERASVNSSKSKENKQREGPEEKYINPKNNTVRFSGPGVKDHLNSLVTEQQGCSRHNLQAATTNKKTESERINDGEERKRMITAEDHEIIRREMVDNRNNKTYYKLNHDGINIDLSGLKSKTQVQINANDVNIVLSQSRDKRINIINSNMRQSFIIIVQNPFDIDNPQNLQQNDNNINLFTQPVISSYQTQNIEGLNLNMCKSPQRNSLTTPINPRTTKEKRYSNLQVQLVNQFEYLIHKAIILSSINQTNNTNSIVSSNTINLNQPSTNNNITNSTNPSNPIITNNNLFNSIKKNVVYNPKNNIDAIKETLEKDESSSNNEKKDSTESETVNEISHIGNHNNSDFISRDSLTSINNRIESNSGNNDNPSREININPGIDLSQQHIQLIQPNNAKTEKHDNKAIISNDNTSKNSSNESTEKKPILVKIMKNAETNIHGSKVPNNEIDNKENDKSSNIISLRSAKVNNENSININAGVNTIANVLSNEISSPSSVHTAKFAFGKPKEVKEELVNNVNDLNPHLKINSNVTSETDIPNKMANEINPFIQKRHVQQNLNTNESNTKKDAIPNPFNSTQVPHKLDTNESNTNKIVNPFMMKPNTTTATKANGNNNENISAVTNPFASLINNPVINTINNTNTNNTNNPITNNNLVNPFNITKNASFNTNPFAQAQAQNNQSGITGTGNNPFSNVNNLSRVNQLNSSNNMFNNIGGGTNINNQISNNNPFFNLQNQYNQNNQINSISNNSLYGQDQGQGLNNGQPTNLFNNNNSSFINSSNPFQQANPNQNNNFNGNNNNQIGQSTNNINNIIPDSNPFQTNNNSSNQNNNTSSMFAVTIGKKKMNDIRGDMFR